MDPIVLGTRVRDARQAANITQEKLSEILDIPRSAISEIENGHRGLSAGELITLSSYLQRSLDFFVQESTELIAENNTFSVRFRTLELQQKDAEAVFRFEQRCRDYCWLEEILNAPLLTQPPTYSLPTPKSRVDAQEQGENLAGQERNRLALGSDPVRDPFQVVESQGVRVIFMKLLTPGISGISHYDEELGACILVNTAFDKNRRGYDLLHEYCHVLTDRVSGTHRTDDVVDPHDPVERRANAFAAAFLLPRDGVEQFLAARGIGQGDSAEFSDVFYVMIAFGASFRATVFRLKELKFLDPRRAKSLLMTKEITEMTTRYRRAAGIEDPSFDDPMQRRFGQLALRAYIKEKISLGRVAELLNTDLGKAREFAWIHRLDGRDEAHQDDL